MQYRACNVYSAHSIRAFKCFWPLGGAVGCSENIEIGSYWNVKKRYTIQKIAFLGLIVGLRFGVLIWRKNIPVKAMNILPVAAAFPPSCFLSLGCASRVCACAPSVRAQLRRGFGGAFFQTSHCANRRSSVPNLPTMPGELF